MSSDVQTLLETARQMHERGWVPATSGNLSLREGAGALITPSGVSKGALRADELVSVDERGVASRGTPSAETLLHLLVYRRFPDAAVVLHAHASHAVTLSRLVQGDIALRGYELAKALTGIRDHETPVFIPVVPNGQDMAALAPQVEAGLERTGSRWAFVLRGHGIYAWGRSASEAFRHLEALDVLFGCQLMELRS